MIFDVDSTLAAKDSLSAIATCQKSGTPNTRGASLQWNNDVATETMVNATPSNIQLPPVHLHWQPAKNTVSTTCLPASIG